MTTNIQLLCNSILTLGSADVATEGAAITALVRCRWGGEVPTCRRCGAPMHREGIFLNCTSGRARHRCTVFVDTPLERLRAVRVRAIFLALRGWLKTKRGLSTLEIAREVNMLHSTLWRHLMLLRSLLPDPWFKAPITTAAAAAQVCGKYKRWRSGVGRRAQVAYVQAASHRIQGDHLGEPSGSGKVERTMAENTRAFLIGTHHGVRAHNLWLYLREVVARALDDASYVCSETLHRFVQPPRPIERRRRRGPPPEASSASPSSAHSTPPHAADA